MAFRIRQGLESARTAVIPALGEPLWTTDTNKLYIGDGSTPGGVAVSSEVDLTTEGLQDVIGAMFTGNSTSGIVFTYNDTTGKINAVVNFPPSTGGSDYHFNITGIDSTLTQINRSETIQFVGTNGIAVGVSETPGGVTRVNIDGAAVQGNGGSGANLSEVGFFVTGQDSTQSRINNDETMTILGAGGISVSVNDTGQALTVTVDGSNIGSIATSSNIFSIPYYNSLGNDLVSAATDARFSPEAGCLSANILGANTVISQVVSTPLNITSILADVPSAGQITIQYPAHPHPPFYVQRYVKLENCTPSVWNGVYEVISSTTTSTVLRASYSGILVIPDIGTPTVARIINIGTLSNTTAYFQINQPLILAAGSIGSFGSTTTVTSIDTVSTITITGLSSHTSGNVNFYPAWSSFPAYINNGTIRETTQRGLNVFATGENSFLGIGGTIDLNDSRGPIEYPGKLRVLDNTTFFGDGQIAIIDVVQTHNSPLANSLNLSRTRGTYSTPLAVQNGDALGAITFQGFDGVNSKTVTGFSMPVSASIFARAAETPAFAQLSLAGELVFQTSKIGAGYVLSDALILDKDQNATFFGSVNVNESLNIDSQIRISGNLIETVVSNASLDFKTNGNGAINLDADTFISGTLVVSTVNTSDSSSITFNPAVIFNSDITVENDLVVNNKIYATEFVSTSVGTPEIVTTSNFNIKVNGNSWMYSTNGGFKVPILTASPVSPVTGAFYVADGVSWDPDTKSGSVPYPVFYDGASFNALY